MSLFSSDKLKGKRIAILATDGFEQAELTWSPRNFSKTKARTVDVISLKSGSIKGWDEKDWGDKVDVDKTLADAKAWPTTMPWCCPAAR